jgi:aspartate/methionine/tyrosine aminotransferase
VLKLQGIWTAITAVVEKDDEVIVFSPWFDIYEGSVACVGAKLVQVPLKMDPGAKSSSGRSII